MSKEEMRKEMEVLCKEVGQELVTVMKACGVQVGFALLVFDFGDTGTMAYTSNGTRDSMITALKELLVELQGQ